MKSIMRIIVSIVVVLGLLANIGIAAEIKTVVLMEFPVDPTRADMKQQMLTGLAQAGFQENQNLKVVSFDSKKPADWPAQVAQLAPDLVIDFSGETATTAKLREIGVPTVSYWGADPYIGPDGVPTANITGVYTAYKDTVYNSLKFLRMVAPLKPGQKAVFFENKQRTVFPKA
jgi:hypothetical protein